MNRTVAAVDCGTNSLRILIADPAPDGGLIERVRRTEIVRLGQGVDATGRFADEALSRTFAVLDDYAHLLAAYGVGSGRIRMVATSAARDVANRDAFFAGVRHRIGVVPDVISGVREARLSYVGALGSAAVRDALGEEPVLVVDIGGGSTELVIGTGDGEIAGSVSLPMGSVRLTERFLPSSPPAAAELAAATGFVDGLLDDCGLELGRVRSAVGVAGTVVTLAWLAGAAPADQARMPGAVISRAALDAVAKSLAARSAEQIRAVPGMHPGRADVITAGALIADRIVRRLAATGLVVSVADILDGVALEIVSDAG
ncbi:Ppx/GppA phosphatase family protein [Microlunatus ginsengisoli]|uniref:Ppx/GppA phosphatase family protein n=1 Tax=Microlunatus ginsengisoli TaxID=363863 RepID=A0ABP7ATM1_9ACTN